MYGTSSPFLLLYRSTISLLLYPLSAVNFLIGIFFSYPFRSEINIWLSRRGEWKQHVLCCAFRLIGLGRIFIDTIDTMLPLIPCIMIYGNFVLMFCFSVNWSNKREMHFITECEGGNGKERKGVYESFSVQLTTFLINKIDESQWL